MEYVVVCCISVENYPNFQAESFVAAETPFFVSKIQFAQLMLSDVTAYLKSKISKTPGRWQ